MGTKKDNDLGDRETLTWKEGIMFRILRPFEFVEPHSLKEVVELVDGIKSKVLAGGVDLVLKMRRRETVPERVVSLQNVPGLDYVTSNGRDLKLGALATLWDIEKSPLVRKKWPLLQEAIGGIVSTQVKVMGTAVGNLCVGTPASDLAPALYVMGAKVRITGRDSEREIPIEAFFLDTGRTALNPHEIVKEIYVPGSEPGSRGVFMKLSKTAEDIAKVNVAVMLTMKGAQSRQVRIALGSVAPTPIRAKRAENILAGKELDSVLIEKASEAAAEEAKPISDIRSTAEYRRNMVRVLVRDALQKASGNVER
ncbi:MAG: xanthine dehydrogenase family protein subunit M [Deltaproteobacteria bacterium]|nr:xanthine dehydrogenase family protein subunit M [Deltaproteobacteria bacterium]